MNGSGFHLAGWGSPIRGSSCANADNNSFGFDDRNGWCGAHSGLNTRLLVGQVSMKIIISLSAALPMLLLASCVQDRGCLLRVANQDHDSSSSQKIHADMDELIHSRPVDGEREVNAELVVSQLELSREGRRNRRIFYVLTDGSGKLLTAGTCGIDERQCASIIVKRMLGFCERM